MALQFSRDTKVYLDFSGSIWEIPVLDGFSFSQATNASEITLNEMESSNGTSRRARQMFNDSLAPAEWSFTTYMRPTATTFPVEDVLWAAMLTGSGSAGWSGSAYSSSAISGTSGSGQFDITPASGNRSNLETFDLYFVMGASDTEAQAAPSYSSGAEVTIYKISSCVVNEASMDFDVDGIAQINWSGFGKLITDEDSFSSTSLVTRSVTSTANFIRNRLTSLSVSSQMGTKSYSAQFSPNPYNVTLTGGNITVTNNISYLTPETLGVVNQPLEHVTGTRTVTGSFTCYLGTGTNESTQLFEDLATATSVITNEFKLLFSIGGSGTPRVEVEMPRCHLEIPVHQIEDVIALETTFHALPTTIDDADEVTIRYRGA